MEPRLGRQHPGQGTFVRWFQVQGYPCAVWTETLQFILCSGNATTLSFSSQIKNKNKSLVCIKTSISCAEGHVKPLNEGQQVGCFSFCSVRSFIPKVKWRPTVCTCTGSFDAQGGTGWNCKSSTELIVSAKEHYPWERVVLCHFNLSFSPGRRLA